MSVFIFSLLCSLGAGPLLNAYGWKTMHLILVPWVLGLAVPLLWLALCKKRHAITGDEVTLPLP